MKEEHDKIDRRNFLKAIGAVAVSTQAIAEENKKNATNPEAGKKAEKPLY